MLARIEHRRWCAEYLIKGFRPLTRIPSEHPGFSRTEREPRLISEWFETNGQKKRAFKRAMRHVDLVPFGDFEKLFHQARQEEAKDLDQIRALDLLLK